MSTWWKVLIGLVVALPTLAYVAGTLAATGSEPAPREPIVLEESVAPSTSASPEGAPPTTTPGRSPAPSRTGVDADDDGDDDDGPQTITPSPDDLDDDDDDEGRDDDDDHGDNRGRGNSDDRGADDD